MTPAASCSKGSADGMPDGPSAAPSRYVLRDKLTFLVQCVLKRIEPGGRIAMRIAMRGTTSSSAEHAARFDVR